MKHFSCLFAFILVLALSCCMLSACAVELVDEDDNKEPSGSDYDYSAGLTEEGFFEGVTAKDYVTLPKYKGLTIPTDVTTAAAEKVQEQIDVILANNQEYAKVTDRAIADGDIVNIDYIGRIDGVEFQGGNTNGAGTNVTIGVTNYVDDFIDQLIGHMPGETFDVEVTFPDPYENNPDLAGKDAVFAVTINYIQGEAIKMELTDEIAAKYGFNTAAELISDVERWLIETQKSEYVNKLLAESTCTEIPQSVLDFIINESLAYYRSYAENYGMDLDTFFANYANFDSADAFIEANTETFRTTAINYLAIQAIAELENLSVDDATFAASGYAEYVGVYGKGYVNRIILGTTVVPDFIFANAAGATNATDAQ